jgi:hypothetical protein
MQCQAAATTMTPPPHRWSRTATEEKPVVDEVPEFELDEDPQHPGDADGGSEHLAPGEQPWSVDTAIGAASLAARAAGGCSSASTSTGCSNEST